MSPRPRAVGRLLTAVTLGLLAVASCAGAAPPSGGAREAVVDPLTTNGAAEADPLAKRAEAEKPPEKGDAGPPGDSDAGAPKCPYGELSDPHRGFIRCLTPDERDAGWLPPAPQDPPSASDNPDGGGVKPAVPAPPAGPAPAVEIGAPKFENGEVPRTEKVLTGLSGDIGKCVADHGGLGGAAGSIKVQFLVRARGKAEGVEVLSAKGVGGEAAACVRHLLKNRNIGAPSSDPVGVTVVISLKPGAAK